LRWRSAFGAVTVSFILKNLVKYAGSEKPRKSAAFGLEQQSLMHNGESNLAGQPLAQGIQIDRSSAEFASVAADWQMIAIAALDQFRECPQMALPTILSFALDVALLILPTDPYN
jgi:hypothetical protein